MTGLRTMFAWSLAGASPATTLTWPKVASDERSGDPCGRQVPCWHF